MSPICSFLIVLVPFAGVIISLSYSPSPGYVQFKVKLIETSYLLLCSLPYKEFIIDSKTCNKQSSYLDSEAIPLNDTKCKINDSKNLEVDPYSDLNTYMLGILQDQNEQALKAEGTGDHGFNLFTSEKIGLWRNVPDVRSEICKDKKYEESLPTASVVMCFYNEAWSTLLRSIYSILSRTPQNLIREIILIDDHSSFDYLKSPLDEYIKANFCNVKIIHSPIRLGLIRARMEGAKHATGEVLIFLDSHIEVGINWLPPLLSRIASNRKCVVIPIVDTIEGETMVYRMARLVRGGFTWSLLHNWEQLPLDVLTRVENEADPFISPTMPGGLFAMERNYFYELGEYDSGMDIWGGENMEISFRIWQCGGRLEIVPCSRIGHVFRQFRPYSSPDGQDTTTRNAARVAHVWLDEYKKHFFDVRPTAKMMDYGDVSDRVALRQRLGCKSFHWYLEHIHPEQVVPGEKPKVPGAFFRRITHPPANVLAKGYLTVKGTDLCASPHKMPLSKGTEIYLDKCLQQSGMFLLTDDHAIKLKSSDSNLCFETRGIKFMSVSLMKCARGGAQTWLQIEQNGHQVLYSPPSGKCLAASKLEIGIQLGLDFCSRPTTHNFLFKQF